ncbi:hypothetical protein [Microvirga sp. Mcv34]|uniref:hypothetical protein n=1 Tax=Microvirga sp. Mcv34 TaxID=2926016 RepID=UPI0021C927C5|nr:hypothetical protein [Microvirga sp. Mcv34]
MRIQSCLPVIAIAFTLSVASGASAAETMNGLSTNGLSTNGLSTNGLSTNGQDPKGAASTGMRLDAAILQDGSVIQLRQ